MVRIDSLHINQAKFCIPGHAMAQAASHWHQRPHRGGTDSILGQLTRFVVEKMTRFYSVSTIPTVLQPYIQLHIALTRKQTG